ncbi:hypothetical protein BAMA_00255 [Bacillus manliponensis]|uniref:DUF418 domain-containing protein n=1 Tax=Bacillus manliponensis TaxID=574376 RepID=A0A073K412_9BACI|nr:DUF418 domain-containing protein [Bacillus manliponensis]KEK21240.1 hypothetical protein BAMA_00255 [Bacillus manliponensis]
MQQRIEVLDIIRGFSLLGILVVNMTYFKYGFESYPEYELPSLDFLIEEYINFFAVGNFITLFSFLFGISIVMLQKRAHTHQESFFPIYFRRISLLILFGLIHTIFIWDGDILLAYGMIGIILTMFLNRKPKTIFIWASFIFLLYTAFSYPIDDESFEYDDISEYEITEAEVHIEGSYTEHIKFRVFDEHYEEKPTQEWIELFTDALGWGFTLLPNLLFGMYVGKKEWLYNLSNYTQSIWKVWIWSATLSFSIKIIGLFLEHPIVTMLHDGITPLSMAIFYTTSIILFVQHGQMVVVSRYFANVGKMCITNYVMQSLITTTLFYSYGFSLAGKLGAFYGLLLTIIIYTAQAFFSTYWLTKFYIGPIEYIWRFGTYWKRPTFIRKKQ